MPKHCIGRDFRPARQSPRSACGASHWSTPDARARLADELADVLIYLVRLADVTGIDVVAAAHAKTDRNAERFPPSPGA